MTSQTLSILILDSALPEQQPVLEALNKQGFRCEAVSSPDEATMRLDQDNFDATIVYQRAAADHLDDFVDSARTKQPRLAIIVVQSEYDGRQECRLFDLGADDIVTLEYSPALLATPAALRTKNRREMIFP